MNACANHQSHTVHKALNCKCFYRCLSVHGGRGCAWRGGHAWWGHVWQGGVHGGGCGGWGACMVGVGWGHTLQGGVCGRGGGHVWQGVACMACPQQILQDTVNERTVHILLECILVVLIITSSDR